MIPLAVLVGLLIQVDGKVGSREWMNGEAYGRPAGPVRLVVFKSEGAQVAARVDFSGSADAWFRAGKARTVRLVGESGMATLTRVGRKVVSRWEAGGPSSPPAVGKGKIEAAAGEVLECRVPWELLGPAIAGAVKVRVTAEAGKDRLAFPDTGWAEVEVSPVGYQLLRVVEDAVGDVERGDLVRLAVYRDTGKTGATICRLRYKDASPPRAVNLYWDFRPGGSTDIPEGGAGGTSPGIAWDLAVHARGDARGGTVVGYRRPGAPGITGGFGWSVDAERREIEIRIPRDILDPARAARAWVVAMTLDENAGRVLDVLGGRRPAE